MSSRAGTRPLHELRRGSQSGSSFELIVMSTLLASLAVNVALLAQVGPREIWPITLLPAAFLPQRTGPGRTFVDKVVAATPLPTDAELDNFTARKPNYAAPHLSAEDIRDAGSVFFYERFAQLVAQDDVRKAFGDDELVERPVGKPAIDLLGVSLSEQELREEKLRPETVETLVERLDKHGFFVLPRVIDPEVCRRLVEETHRLIHNPRENFGLINKAELRKDHPLELQGDVLDVMRKVLGMLSPVLTRVLGEDPRLRELSTLTTYPGAPSQPFHPDTRVPYPGAKVTKLLSSFVYLDDIGMDQAPLDLFPGTHTHAFFLRQSHQKWLGLRAPFVRVAVPQGSLVMYDSRLRHRGSGNNSPLVRPTIYFSVQENVDDEAAGSTYSIYDDYEEMTVRDVLEGKIPKRDKDFFMDEKCFENMKRKCPGLEHEDLFKCSIVPKGTPIREGEDYWPTTTEGFDLPKRCFLVSRIEMLAKANIFRPNFEKRASWGPLPPV